MLRLITFALTLAIAVSSAHAQGARSANTKNQKWTGGPQPEITPKAPPIVTLRTGHRKGTILIDTKGRRLFSVISSTKAYRYPISVGRVGFQWSGNSRVSAKKSWPDWRPPAEMRKRQPKLPVLMTGGVHNPLGAKALYLGSSLYRIHGTNNRRSIGQASSSGCFRMHNEHVMHLARITPVGTRVRVMKALPRKIAPHFARRTAKRQSHRRRQSSSQPSCQHGLASVHLRQLMAAKAPLSGTTLPKR